MSEKINPITDRHHYVPQPSGFCKLEGCARKGGDEMHHPASQGHIRATEVAMRRCLRLAEDTPLLNKGFSNAQTDRISRQLNNLADSFRREVERAQHERDTW